MSSTISSIGGYSSMMMGMMGRMQRPDSTRLAEDLFSQIDSSGNGYITQSDLESAFSKLSSSSDSTSSTTAADEIFSKLDSNGDGKVTQDEMTSGIKALSDALDNQFQSMRMSDAMGGMGGTGGMNGMPPPPPPPENDTGFTQDELQSQLDQIGSSDSQRASLLTDVVNNFDAADTNGDGKVTFQEAMAYEQSSGSSSSTSTATSSTDSTSSTSSDSSTVSDAQLMLKILQLMHAYGADTNSASTSTVSATA
jgi:Ca2+-binding EF-hand superfamily protein